MIRGLLAACLCCVAACQRGAPAAPPPPCTPDTWDSYGNAFFEEQCNHCHESTYQTHRNVQLLGWSVIDTVSHGRMPPKDSPLLSDAEKARLLTYLKCNAP